MPQAHPDLLQEPVLLVKVARTARRNDIVPGVPTAPGLRYHVVDALGLGSAVLALVTITGEHGSAVQSSPSVVGNPHVVPHPHHRRLLEG